jgi:tetratricopeptide (TPR) repeat protein
MTTLQKIVSVASLALFCFLYFGFDTKAPEHSKLEASRAIQGESTAIESLLEEAKTKLSATQLTTLETMTMSIEKSSSDKEKTAILKKISGFWYAQGELPVAGDYAEKAATLENTDSSWSVAGATYFTGLTKSTDKTIRDFCSTRAVKAFENAVSLAPNNASHRVNVALVYAENPSADNPMQAVLLLRDLEQKYPDAPSVYNALGRLAIKTGQWQRAVDRFEKSWTLDKTNIKTPCFLVKAYEELGNSAKVAEYAKLCK